MAAKGKGILGRIADMALEHDESDQHTSATTSSPAASSAPTGGFTAPMATAFAAQPPASVLGSSIPTSLPTIPTEIDPEALQTFKQMVYVSQVGGHPSNFILFLNMWQALGQPTDPNVVVKALQVTNPNLTAEAIVGDIDAHGILLDNAAAQAKQSFDGLAQETLGGNDAEIADLTKRNETAAAEIKRHQQETEQRNTRLKELQGLRGENEAKLNRGRASAVAAETQVRNELASMKKLFVR